MPSIPSLEHLMISNRSLRRRMRMDEGHHRPGRQSHVVDSKLLMEHTDWFTTNERGALVAPNADWTDVADLNYDHHELRKYMIEMMKYWVREIGIDGYRCDVAEMVPTDFWSRARKELDKIKPVLMLSEGSLPEHHVDAFDLTYSWSVYDVLGKIIDGTTPVTVFEDILRTESYQFPKGSLRLRFNTNHDKNSWMHRL